MVTFWTYADESGTTITVSGWANSESLLANKSLFCTTNFSMLEVRLSLSNRVNLSSYCLQLLNLYMSHCFEYL